MTRVRSLGSTSTSKCRQPGSLRASRAFSSAIFIQRSTFSGLIRISTCSTNIDTPSGFRICRRHLGPDPLDDQAVVLGTAVGGEVEHRPLEIGGEVDVSVAHDHLVVLGLALHCDLAGGSDDERMAEHAKA